MSTSRGQRTLGTPIVMERRKGKKKRKPRLKDADRIERHLYRAAARTARGADDGVRRYNKARKKLHVNPRDPAALRELVLVLATDESPDERNGHEALEYAQKLLDITGHDNALTLILISAAYAELQHFTEASEWAKKAFKVARSNKQKDLSVRIQRYINLYKRNIPLRGEAA